MVTQTSLANSQPNIEQIISVITKPIIGETCHQVTFSYGDELRLDFGEMSAYNHPKLKHLRKGSWQFCTRATSWIFQQGDQVLTSKLQVNIDAEIDTVKKLLQQLENKELINLVNDNFIESDYWFFTQEITLSKSVTISPSGTGGRCTITTVIPNSRAAIILA